jgi:hypothetical protein
MAMDTAYISAFAALAGSAIGGLTSFFSSWLGQSAQRKAQLTLLDKTRREELYRDFVDRAASLYIDALTRDTPDLSQAITLYALISRMRVLSSPRVVEQAHSVALLIIETYSQTNKTFHDIQTMVSTDGLDPLRGFADACRQELHGLP